MTGQNIFAEVYDSAVALPDMGGNAAGLGPATEGATVDSEDLAGLRDIVELIVIYYRCFHSKILFLNLRYKRTRALTVQI